MITLLEKKYLGPLQQSCEHRNLAQHMYTVGLRPGPLRWLPVQIFFTGGSTLLVSTGR